MKLTAGGYEDYRAGCPCRHSDPPKLCEGCQRAAMVLLIKDGFGHVLDRLAAEERGLLKIAREYIRGARR